MSEKFAVVLFKEEDVEEVGLIPTCWMVDENFCYWPPFKSTAKVTRAIQRMWTPEASSSVYAIRVLAKCCKLKQV